MTLEEEFSQIKEFNFDEVTKLYIKLILENFNYKEDLVKESELAEELYKFTKNLMELLYETK